MLMAVSSLSPVKTHTYAMQSLFVSGMYHLGIRPSVADTLAGPPCCRVSTVGKAGLRQCESLDMLSSQHKLQHGQHRQWNGVSMDTFHQACAKHTVRPAASQQFQRDITISSVPQYQDPIKSSSKGM